MNVVLSGMREHGIEVIYRPVEERPVHLNLGCGFRKMPDCINIDSRIVCEPDLTWDVTRGLPFASNSVDMVTAIDFLEHIPLGKTVFVIEEIWRVLRNEGKFHHITPSTDGRGAFQDPTHQSFWNINSWLYYTNKEYRELYNIKADFGVITLYDTESDKVKKIVHTVGEMWAVK